MGLNISRVLHAGYIFESSGVQIAFDPIFENPFSRNCFAFPDVRFDHSQIKKLTLSAVFISHYHDDHCSLDSLNLLHRETPIYLYCVHDELFQMIRDLGFKNVHPLDLHISVHVGPFEVTPLLALDADVDSIFHIQAMGQNVLNVVDSWIPPSTLQRLLRTSWDLILWPFQTMREMEVLSPTRYLNNPVEIPPEWSQQLKALNPRYVIPSSCQFRFEPWSWYNEAFFPITYQHFQNEIQKILPTAQIIRLDPSQSIQLMDSQLQSAPPLPWVTIEESHLVDYTFSKNIRPPSTADMANKLGPLTAQKAKRVMEFCNQQILERYQELEPSTDPFFEKPRIWQLSIFDHEGERTDFFYRLEQKNIKISDANTHLISWSTEIPALTLYGALEEGESLTSLYIRINDLIFEGEIENEIQEVDLLEDPLLRCLYSGVFGSYQKAQLQRILQKSF